MNSIKKPEGKLGVLIAGINGAVSTTFLAGVLSIIKGKAKPIGSLTQMATIRIGDRSENKFPLINDFVPLVKLSDLVFGGWDIDDVNCFQATKNSGVLEEKDFVDLKNDLESIKVMKGVFEQKYVQNLKGSFIKEGKTKYELMEKIREDIRNFKKENNLQRVVTIWCGSTEVFIQPSDVHMDTDSFEKGMKENHDSIAPSMLYAYAAISEGSPFINGAPNLTTDFPAMIELAKKNNVPVSGKDFKTGQTLLKTVLAPMLKARMIGLEGWFSSNILGNKDGLTLDDPGSFKTKENSKLSVLDTILQPDIYPDLYKDYFHKVRINYYPPRGDNKEGWDNIDIFGWLGYKMQLKVDFLCKDSILAAPIVLDLILFSDLAQRSGLIGIQSWLSFYFKSPMHQEGVIPEHDLFIQLMKLKNNLRSLKGERTINHVEENETIRFQ